MDDTKVKIFKDSVHGYINVPLDYVNFLIDNTYFQRLRNIAQTGMRVLYPTAKHDRFSHSLGVFHLGQKAIEALLKDSNDNIFAQEDRIRYKVLFLTACLLHDIGHTPFSHSLEDQILKNSIITQHQKGQRTKNDKKQKIDERLIDIINEKEAQYCSQYNIQQREIKNINAAAHEQLGSYLIFDKFTNKIKDLEQKYNILGNDVDFGDDLCFIVRMIMGIKYEEFSPSRQVRNCFIELLNGDNFDVDKLDYIVRDTQMSGIDNVVVDVERLLGSLCVITKTKHLNKVKLAKQNIKNLTISKISNMQDGDFKINGNFKGIIKIFNGSIIEIGAGSKIEVFKGVEHDIAKIAYIQNDQAVFSSTTALKQDNDWVNAQEMSGYNKAVKLLTGEPNNKDFGAYFEHAELMSCLKIKAKADLEIHIFGKCSFAIKGKFESIGSLKLFTLSELDGTISEVEILGNTFQQDFTSIKTPTEHGYNTYSIGFKKQAINVIANVLDARNYLYLWVYAHHKVIYYADFLIPVITKEISKYCGNNTLSFPTWQLSYDSLEQLDDYYIWTVIKYLQKSKTNKLKKVYIDLINQLFSRVYNKSLYKSLAEFELVFDSFTMSQKLAALSKLQSNTDTAQPFLGDRKVGYLAGYLNSNSVAEINNEINKLCNSEDNPHLYINLSEVIYIVTKFKQKKLNPHEVFLDMVDEILPISQIPLLFANHIENKSKKDKYFYIYYKDDSDDTSSVKTRIIKEAIKNFLSEY